MLQKALLRLLCGLSCEIARVMLFALILLPCGRDFFPNGHLKTASQALLGESYTGYSRRLA